MKKITYVLSAFILAINIANAKPVKPAIAQKVAENFYTQNSKTKVISSTLVYTEVSAGLPIYYAFDINGNDGFVIIAAEDATRPIIGYSTTNHFVVPNSSENTNIGYWLKACSTGINTMRTKNRTASAEAALEWEKYINNNPNLITAARLTGNASTTSSNPTVAPLCQTTWNQSPLYNALCPGTGTNQAVTGCVATAMAQIMRYWSYPATGTGSSSYNAGSYGTLSATYSTTTYNWANMPFSINTPNHDVALINYHCGVSVDMNYSPTGSGAWVITSDDPICAQNSYVTYFKYDPSTIQGLRRGGYTESAWLALIESDLNLGRPVQYVGDDPIQGDGHTWVCDGYDQNNYLHMNWGWGGYSDGFFQVDSLSTPGFDPSSNHQVVVGIVPLTSNSLDVGIPVINSPVGFYCNNTANDSISPVVKLLNYGSTTLFVCNINYSIDGGAVQTQNWNGSLVSYQGTFINLPKTLLSAGSHTLTCYSSNPNGSTDENTANDQYTVTFNITNGASLPIIEGFEAATSLPNSNWNISHTSPSMQARDFQVTSTAAATGSNSCMLNNMMNNAGGNNSFIQISSFYDMTTFTTPVLTFKAAYQEKATTNADKLQVAVSIDCGLTWMTKRVILGSTLASLAGGTGTSTYVPTPSQFTTYTVNINSIVNYHNVMYRWEFLADPNGPGNNLYIDDINIIDNVAGIVNIEAAVNLNLYPNPSDGKVNLDFILSEQHNIAVSVTDMLGRVVETIPAKSYQSGETTLTIGADKAYQAGIYLVNITIDGQRISKKIVIQ